MINEKALKAFNKRVDGLICLTSACLSSGKKNMEPLSFSWLILLLVTGSELGELWRSYLQQLSDTGATLCQVDSGWDPVSGCPDSRSGCCCLSSWLIYTWFSCWGSLWETSSSASYCSPAETQTGTLYYCNITLAMLPLFCIGSICVAFCDPVLFCPLHSKAASYSSGFV